MSLLKSVGHYEFADTELFTAVDNVCQLLSHFTQGNYLSATLNPYKVGGIVSHSDVCESPDTLFLYTSGTTGTPKKIEKKNMSQFLQNKRGTGSPEDRWVLTYHPYRWAGITMLAHIIKHNSVFLVPNKLDTKEIVAIALAEKATHISLTPSMFRKMMIDNKGSLEKCAFKQVTFGGEVANQAILEWARALFPEARVSHTYASTEHGDICSASDCIEGFPLTKFKNFTLTDDGELIINGVTTGDYWETREGRAFFAGRNSDVVNVGGDKISLSHVENKIMGISGVDLARAKPSPSPILGNIVTVDYVGSIEPLEVMRAARQLLPKFAVAKAYKVDSIDLSTAGKIKR